MLRRKRQSPAVPAASDNGSERRKPPTRTEIATWLSRADLPHLPSFVTVEEFLAAIAERRTRPLSLHEAAGWPAGLFGVCVVGPEEDRIAIDGNLSGTRRDLVILHEMAHILLGHRPSKESAAAVPTAALREAGIECEDSFVMARDHFDDEQEWQAEWLATYFLSRTRGLQRSSWIGQRGTQYAAVLLHGNQ